MNCAFYRSFAEFIFEEYIVYTIYSEEYYTTLRKMGEKNAVRNGLLCCFCSSSIYNIKTSCNSPSSHEPLRDLDPYLTDVFSLSIVNLQIRILLQ